MRKAAADSQSVEIPTAIDLHNEIIALEKGVKSGAFQILTDTHHQLQKVALLASISRTYRPKDDEGIQWQDTTASS